MNVKFKQDVELSPNGIDTKIYKKGETYATDKALERKSFQIAIENGFAEVVPEKVDTKVEVVAEKKATKSKAKKS